MPHVITSTHEVPYATNASSRHSYLRAAVNIFFLPKKFKGQSIFSQSRHIEIIIFTEINKCQKNVVYFLIFSVCPKII
jgi:hypothetical protein